MQFLRNIQTHLFSFYRRFKKSATKQHVPVSLQNAKKIGILFDAENSAENATIVAFSEKLKSASKDVQLLGFVSERAFGSSYPFPFFTSKDLSWYGKPGGGTCGYFMHFPFDMLITFSNVSIPTLDYISSQSSAKFRIGFCQQENLKDFDVILLPQKQKTFAGFINSIELYLK